MSVAPSLSLVAFETELGWIALIGSGSLVKQLTFGHGTKAEALAALDQELLLQARSSQWCPALVRRLKEYAAGMPDDFRDVQLDLGHLTPFQQRVVRHCRAIGYGNRRSYGQLAAASGSARAARAVGNAMATNRFPLIVPCHRVVNSNGSIGHFGAPQGSRMKARLLDMEDQVNRIPSASARLRKRPR